MSKKKLYPFQKILKRDPQSSYIVKDMPNMSILKNERIYFKNGYSISIQCSYHSYSYPRTNIEDPSQYTAYEIGVFLDEQQANLPDIFGIQFEDGWLAGYVPAEIVQKLINYLKKQPTRTGRINAIKEITDL